MNMKRITILCLVISLTGCTKPTAYPDSIGDVVVPSAALHDQHPVIVLSGVQGLDVELVSFRATNNRRQTWVFEFHQLSPPAAFSLELNDDNSFATSFIKKNPEFMKEYWNEKLALGKKKKWDYTKPINPSPRFHIKVEVETGVSMARIFDWKPIE